MRNVQVPDTSEASAVGVARAWSLRRDRPVKRDRGPVRIPRRGGWEAYVFQSVNRTDVEYIFPGRTEVVRYRDARAGPVTATNIREHEIRSTRSINRKRGIVAADYDQRRGGIGASSSRTNGPGCTVVLRDNHGLCPAAGPVRYIHRPIG